MEKKIRIIHNDNIDLGKWDNRVKAAANARIYAESWYLDMIEPDWMGLVYGDYKYVMPLVVASKLGISYIYQPRFAQQFGLYPPATPVITDEIIGFLSKEYSYINLTMNALNVSVKKLVEVESKENYLLSLKPSIDEIRKSYNSHARRYVKKARQKCQVDTSIGIEDFLRLKAENARPKFSVKLLKKLKLIVSRSLSDRRGIVYGAYNKHNELCAVAFFLKEEKRYTYLNSVSTPEGKKERAMFAIVDRFIEDHAGEAMMLDFEGSNIEGIARFFKGFGATAETYELIRYNILPWYLKIFKK